MLDCRLYDTSHRTSLGFHPDSFVSFLTFIISDLQRGIEGLERDERRKIRDLGLWFDERGLLLTQRSFWGPNIYALINEINGSGWFC